MICGLASWIIQELWNNINPESMYWLPLWAKMLVTKSLPPHQNERQPRINNFSSCIFDNRRAVQQHQAITNVMPACIRINASGDIDTIS